VVLGQSQPGSQPVLDQEDLAEGSVRRDMLADPPEAEPSAYQSALASASRTVSPFAGRGGTVLCPGRRGVVIQIGFAVGMSTGKWIGGLAGVGCAAAVVAFSWAPFAI
jgi:hypothetical protein